MMTPGKSLLNQRPVIHYFGYFTICIPFIFLLYVVAVLSGCQQKPASTLSPAISSQAQLKQLSLVAAGTRYFKNKYSRSGLLTDEAICRAVVDIGKAHGWGSIDAATLNQNNNRLYQWPLRDSTPEATQYSRFNRQLAPFITSLRSD